MLAAVGNLRLLRRLVPPEVTLNVLFAREDEKCGENASDALYDRRHEIIRRKWRLQVPPNPRPPTTQNPEWVLLLGW